MSDNNVGQQGMWKYISPLKKSSIRQEVFWVLCGIYPEGASLNELIRATGHCKIDVIGVLTGYRSRYNKNYSLTGLGIVSYTTEMVDGKAAMIFIVTPRGIQVRDYLTEYEFLSAFSRSNDRFEMLRNWAWTK